MDEITARAFADIIEKSLQSAIGKQWLMRTHQHLIDAYQKRMFNSERALEMYTITIERSVLAFMKGTAGYMTMKCLREDGITHKMAMELVEQFKEATGAQDQRPARKGLWAKIVGK